MGIAGLLPALKSIQETRHLSQFSGKTVAVDAYVWLHKGIYSCATELATGKRTRKYIDYAMHRVRLLRHYNIEPYIVFDGGPLPAKQGTELDRKQRRDEYLARGNALAAQGRNAQARECYIKCVDVTPQMAYQLIKALRAESVPYIVAPYEADAQLAYLERIGLVDAILTEDSDLLVYGCKTVLFKLDTVEATVVSISRKDFGSVAPPSSEISLVGWSDSQFRAMAILSGCDYLSSIPGIGLKTACSLLRKWKTVEQVVRVLMLEGKKPVPKEYIRHFQKAERCFLHQRVYCPLAESLVHLTEINAGEWNEERDAYFGRFIDPDSAQKIALGEMDPITHLPMNDIDPSYLPGPSKTFVHTTRFRSHNGKGKAREIGEATPRTGDLFKYFVPVTSSKALGSYPATTLCGARTGCGKRTLADVMELDITRRNEAKHDFASAREQGVLAESKFFVNAGNKKKLGTLLSTSPPCALPIEKENIFGYVNPSPETSKIECDPDEAISEASHCADNGDELIDLDVGHEEVVQQEEGYISPPEMGHDEIEAPELSSPARPLKKRKAHTRVDAQAAANGFEFIDEEDFGAEALSSPPAATKSWTASNIFKRWEYRGNRKADGMATGIERRHSFPLSSLQRARTDINACVITADIKQNEECADISLHSSHVMDDGPEGPRDKPKGEVRKVFPGPDLFLDDVTQVEETLFDNTGLSSGSGSPAPSASPDTPADENRYVPQTITDRCDGIEILDENQVMFANEARTKIVMDGWRARWARQSPELSRSNSNSTRKTPKSRTARSANAFRFSGHTMLPGTSGLKRRETNVTPRGRHSLRVTQSHVALGGGTAGRPCIDLTAGDDDH